MAWRPQHINYRQRPHDEMTAAEREEKLQRTSESALETAVIEELFPPNKPEAWPKAIQRMIDLKIVPPGSDVESICNTLVRDLRNFFERDHDLPQKWKRHLFLEAAHWLVVTNVLRLNTCRDWSVNRKNPAENVGLKSFEALEAVLTNKYPLEPGEKKRYHLHSGSGDNSSVYAANHDDKYIYGDGRSRKDVWSHIGFGNKLYASIETLLGRFLQEYLRDERMNAASEEIQIIIRVLTEAIQKKLHKRWYAPEGVTEKTTWKPTSHHQDLNEILELLQNPAELLEGISFPHSVPIHIAEYQLSGKFSGDQKVRVPIWLGEEPELQKKALSAYTELMKFSGMSKRFIRYEMLDYELHQNHSRIGSVGAKVSELERKARKLKTTKSSVEELKEVESMITNLKEDRDELRRKIERTEGGKETDESILKEWESLPEVIQTFSDYDKVLLGKQLFKDLEKLHKQALDRSRRRERELKKISTAPKIEGDEGLQLRESQNLAERRYLRQTAEEKILRDKKLQNVCKALLGDLWAPAIVTDEKEIISLEDAIGKVKTFLGKYNHDELQKQNAQDPTNATSEILKNLFEPEFVAAVDAWKPNTTPDPSKNDVRLIDRESLNEEQKLVIPVEENTIVRVDGMLVEKGGEEVQAMGFFIQRIANSIIIDGKNVSPKSTQAQASFALEIIGALDLNKHPYAFLKNFVPGRFQEMGHKFPPESFSMISAVRSDSHINDTSFRKLVGDYLRVLKPGGCVITDGIEESYSQVIRLIESVPPEIARVEIVMSGKNRPISLFIQKAHPKGYLTDEEKKHAFRTYEKSEKKEDRDENCYKEREEKEKEKSVYFLTPEQLMHRPDEEIRNDVCREIRELFGAEGFKHVQQQLELDRSMDQPSRLQQLLIASAVGERLRNDSELFNKAFMQRLAAQILERDASESNPRGKLIGSALRRKLKPLNATTLVAKFPTADALPRRSIWEIRTALMRVLQPLDESSDLIERLEKCIVHAFVDAPTTEKRREELLKLFTESRNLDCRKNTRLPEYTINYVQRRTALRARRTITKTIAEKEGLPIRDTIGWIRQFPRRGEPEEVPEFRTTLLPDNAEHATPEAIERLQFKMEQVRELAWKIRKKTRNQPIGFIDFTDCVTNDILEDRLKEIFGVDFGKMVQKVPCIFRGGEENAQIKQVHALESILDCWYSVGNRLVMAGGSWADSFDGHGKLFRRMIGPHLDSAEEKNVQGLGICFASQVVGDHFGLKDDPVTETHRGPLEIGLSAITPTGKGPRHPIFEDCGPCTVIMSRGGHLLGPQLFERGRNMQVLARSDSTGTPVVWEALKNNFVGIQFHPEARCVENENGKTSTDCRKILGQLDRFPNKEALKDRFNCHRPVLKANFDTHRAKIKGNAGPEILMNALVYQLSKIQRNLR